MEVMQRVVGTADASCCHWAVETAVQRRRPGCLHAALPAHLPSISGEPIRMVGSSGGTSAALTWLSLSGLPVRRARPSSWAIMGTPSADGSTSTCGRGGGRGRGADAVMCGGGRQRSKAACCRPCPAHPCACSACAPRLMTCPILRRTAAMPSSPWVWLAAALHPAASCLHCDRRRRRHRRRHCHLHWHLHALWPGRHVVHRRRCHHHHGTCLHDHGPCALRGLERRNRVLRGLAAARPVRDDKWLA